MASGEPYKTYLSFNHTGQAEVEDPALAGLETLQNGNVCNNPSQVSWCSPEILLCFYTEILNFEL
jgi:hypothetical protein